MLWYSYVSRKSRGDLNADARRIIGHGSGVKVLAALGGLTLPLLPFYPRPYTTPAPALEHAFIVSTVVVVV